MLSDSLGGGVVMITGEDDLAVGILNGVILSAIFWVLVIEEVTIWSR